MDKSLLNRVKVILNECEPSNVDEIKNRLMVILKPSDSDLVYEYFAKIEPNYIRDNCKVHNSQVIPQYGDYFTDNSTLKDIFLDELKDLD
jgi:hypothetical protein